MGNGEIISGQPAGDETAAALHVFQSSDNGWQLAATHVVDGLGPSDAFASAMDLDGDMLAVGAPGFDDDRGAVYLFMREPESGEWQQVDMLAVEDSSARLGVGLELHGDMLLAGAPGINSVLVVQNAGATSQSIERLAADGLSEGDRFGESVAYDGERIYVGAPGRDSLAGAVYVFRPTESGYTQEAMLQTSDHKGFGKALAAFAPGLVLAPAPGLSIRDRRALGQRRFSLTRGGSSGPIIELGIDQTGMWRQTIVIDSLFDISIARNAEIPMAVNGEHLLVGLPSSGRRIQVYTRQTNPPGWLLTSEIERLENESWLGSSLAMDGNQFAALATGENYGQGTIVAFTTTEVGVERTGRMALVDEVTLTKSGRVDCEEGTALHFGCTNVDLLAFMPISDLGGESGIRLNDIWGWTDPETGREFAIVGRTNGTAFVDISSPSDPVFVGDLPLTEGARPSSWRDIKVYNNHAFIVADGAGPHGMQVFDLTQLRDVPAPPATFEALTTYDGVGSSHNIVINEATGYAYIVGAGGSGESCGGGLHMVNIQDPANPVFEGCFADTETGRSGTGYSHDAQCVIYNGPDADYSGKEICFNSNETALSISDVTDKENPVAISNATFPNVSYAHQGWLTEDQSFFYMNDELDELGIRIDRTRTMIWDVSDLDDPQLAREFFSENTSSDHNLYIRDNLMYQSNYGSGLRIFDITDMTNPVEVGFFDTITVAPDEPGFIGSWSNYPFFESGTIVVTSIGEGLFLVKKRDVDI